MTKQRDDHVVVECAEKELQSGTKQPENLLAAIPESDATAVDGFSKADAARGLGEHAVKGNAVVTYERVAMTMGVALQVVIAALIGVFWWSFNNTVADVKALQSDVRTIMVEAGKATTSLDGKIDNLATSLGGKIDNLGTTLGGRIDTLTASNAGQFELVTQRLDDLIANKPKR